MDMVHVYAFVINALELVGTVAFAISGALLAINRRCDVFGIIWLALTTAVGGGIIRDVVLGRVPPASFQNPVYIIEALVTTLVILLVTHRYGNPGKVKTFNMFSDVYIICDALGLGVYTMSGMNAAIDCGHGHNLFLLLFVGVITGVGGGMIRDMMAGRTPMVLKREIYAIACVVGAICYYFLIMKLERSPAMLIGAAIVTSVRLISYYMKISFPIAGRGLLMPKKED